MRAALERLNVPVHVIHGDADDFAPIEIAERLVKETHARRPIRFSVVKGANHFFNDGPTDLVLSCIEACIPQRKPWRAPAFPRFSWPHSMSGGAPAAPHH